MLAYTCYIENETFEYQHFNITLQDAEVIALVEIDGEYDTWRLCKDNVAAGEAELRRYYEQIHERSHIPITVFRRV
jgi:type IV secretory pathway ATPase VirB11/archaellum biosynthesis ATPase